MSRTKRNHVVRGVDDNGDDWDWSGCGWVPSGKGKRYDKHDANMVAFDANCARDFTSWAEELKPIKRK